MNSLGLGFMMMCQRIDTWVWRQERKGKEMRERKYSLAYPVLSRLEKRAN